MKKRNNSHSFTLTKRALTLGCCNVAACLLLSCLYAASAFGQAGNKTAAATSASLTRYVPGGKTFFIRTKNNAKKHPYIQSVTFNGKRHSKTYIEHSMLLNGGVLEFTMGAQPNKGWGTRPADWPQSANQ